MAHVKRHMLLLSVRESHCEMHVRFQGCAAAALVGVHLLLKPAAAILSAIVTLVRSQLPYEYWPS